MSVLQISQGKEKVGVFEKVAYAFGDAGSNLYWKTFEFFLLIYYTDVFGLDAATAGTMFFVARVVDGLADPLMGIVADRTQTRWGRFRPYLLWFSLPTAIAGVLAFSPIQAQGTFKTVYAYGTYLLLMLLYSAINIPYSALLGVMSADPVERTSLSAYRFVGAFLASILVQFATLRLVSFFGGSDSAKGWQATMLCYGLLAALLFLACFAAVKERVGNHEVTSSLGGDLRALVTNDAWRVMFGLGIIVIANFSIRGAAAAYYFKYWIGDVSFLGFHGHAEILSLFLTTGGVANLLGVSLTAPLVRHLGKKKLYILLMALGCILTFPQFFLGRQQLSLLFGLHLALNFLLGPTAPLMFSMYADIADYAEVKSGRRTTGLVFAGAMFALKLGGALGGLLTGIVLSQTGYSPGAVQSQSALWGLRMLVGLLPAGACLMACLLAVFYPLHERRMSEIQVRLRSQNRADGAVAASITAK